MIVELHDRPATVAMAAMGVLIVLLVALTVITRLSKKLARGITPLFIVIALVVALPAGVWVVLDERMYDKRDGAIRSKLTAAGIQVVGFNDWDTRVLVRRDVCTAEYLVRQGTKLDAAGVWPLVAGTGVARIGCTNEQLDAIFMPA